MVGATGLRPLTNDPVGSHYQQSDSTGKHTLKQLVVNCSKASTTKNPPAGNSTSKITVGSDEYNDDETVKTANSTINTEITIDTDIIEDNQDDETQRVSDDPEWITVLPKSAKRKKSMLTATVPDEVETPVKAILRNRGDKMIDASETLTTPVKIEFLLTDGKTFNLRSEFIQLFQIMQKVDPTLAIHTLESAWFTEADLPVDDKFMKAFQVEQKNPRRSTQAAIMFVNFSSKATINSIKYSPTVWSKLNAAQIFMYPDKFDRQQTACPGYLINIHPNLVWKERLITEITQLLEKVQIEKHNRVYKRWKQVHPEDEDLSVPFFTIKTGIRKMKDSSAAVLNIISAKADAELLKMLLSRAGETFTNQRWTFVPTGMHLIDSVDLVKSALRTQNEYCNSVTSVAIEGIPELTMQTGGLNGEHMEVTLKKSCKGLHSIEQTNQLSSRGKWHFIVEKVHAAKLRHYLINTVIPELEENGLPVINGIVAGVAGSLMGTTTVGNYATILKKNLTTASVDFTQDNYNSVRPRKRHQIIPTYGRENTSVPENGTSQVNYEQTKTKTAVSNTPTDWNAQLESKLTNMMKAFESTQEQKIKDLEMQFQQKIEKMMEKVMHEFSASMVQAMESMTSQLESVQNSMLKKITQLMQYTPTKHLDMDSKVEASNFLRQTNIAQGRAQNNNFQLINTSSPPHIQDEERMQT